VTRPLPLVVPAAGCDCRICPLYRANPRAIEPICSGCNTDCAYCGIPQKFRITEGSMSGNSRMERVPQHLKCRMFGVAPGYAWE
jgi:tRNA A37 methylthiotransferase MiaB